MELLYIRLNGLWEGFLGKIRWGRIWPANLHGSGSLQFPLNAILRVELSPKKLNDEARSEAMCVNIWSRLGRVSSVFALTLLMAVAASAYTVVMRDGRHIEIPTRFEVTTSTLTYEVSPSVQITIQLAAVDIPATEKANGESPGALLKRVAARSAAPDGMAPRAPAVRTITNRDLESTAEKRRASELAYEKRRQELGLPSVEESRRRAAEESALITSQLRENRTTELENENYWRTRASALRTEIAAIDAEQAVVRRQLEEPNSQWGWGTSSFTTVINAVPFGGFSNLGRGRVFGSGHVSRPSVFVAPASARGPARGQVFQNSLTPHHFPRFGGPLVAPPNLTYFSSSYPYDFSYERSALITRFNQLTAERAALNARWRELENEARRAGAQPGWLRQ